MFFEEVSSKRILPNCSTNPEKTQESKLPKEQVDLVFPTGTLGRASSVESGRDIQLSGEIEEATPLPEEEVQVTPENMASVIIEKARSVDEMGGQFVGLGIVYNPGTYYGVDAKIVVDENGDISQKVIYPNNHDKTFTMEYEHDADHRTTKLTVKDNNGKVRFTEEYSIQNEAGVTYFKTVVKDASGKVIYNKFTKPGVGLETIYTDSSDNEITEYEATRRRNAHCTDSMKEKFSETDKWGMIHSKKD